MSEAHGFPVCFVASFSISPIVASRTICVFYRGKARKATLGGSAAGKLFVWYSGGMEKNFAASKRLTKARPPQYSVRPDHEQIYSPVVDAYIDVNILHIIDFLSLNNVVTLHSCEGNPTVGKAGRLTGQGYIHFLHADHLERALLLLSEKAREAGMMEIAGRALEQGRYAHVLDGKQCDVAVPDWSYAVHWSAGGSHPYVEDSERRGPRGTVFTATVRIPHADVVMLNDYLAP